MSGAPGTKTPRRPWHLWLIGIIGGLWSSMGVISFMLTQMKVEAVMSRFPPQQRVSVVGRCVLGDRRVRWRHRASPVAAQEAPRVSCLARLSDRCARKSCAVGSAPCATSSRGEAIPASSARPSCSSHERNTPGMRRRRRGIQSIPTHPFRASPPSRQEETSRRDCRRLLQPCCRITAGARSRCAGTRLPGRTPT